MTNKRDELINKARNNPGKRVKSYFGYYYSADGEKVYDIQKRFGNMWVCSLNSSTRLKDVIRDINNEADKAKSPSIK